MRTPLLVLSAATTLLSPSFLPAQTRHPRPHTPTSTPGTPNQLPVTRVSLYKNGVGFFEHTGEVTGDQAVSIDFTSAQLNDVLQSLTAIDLGGGRISGAAYNSTTPLEQQLKLLPLALGEAPTSIDVYNSIRGARVEVHSPAGTLSGRLLSVEVRPVDARASPGPAPSPSESAPAPATVTERHFLTVAADSGPQAGTVRTFELTPAVTVRVLDLPLRTDLTHYLELLDRSRSGGLRHLTLLDKAPSGSPATRDLRVSYLSEVPVWKSTYRILFTDTQIGGTPAVPSQAAESKSAINQSATNQTATNQTATLQGWSVVDNTTGVDWINVQLSLIAGSPQSFIQPLSQPIYTRRPEIPIAADAQLTPQTHESSLNDTPPPPPQVAGVAGMSGMAGGAAGGSPAAGSVGASGGVLGGLGSAPIPFAQPQRTGVPTNGRQFQSLNQLVTPPVPYETSAANSIAPNTTTAAFDDYFSYNLTDPVTIRKNESALVPILQTKIQSERVTLWNPTQPQPLRALWITNTSNLTLDRGSFTIVENGSFGGEGLLDPIHPGERRLLSYAADSAVRVSTDSSHDTRRVQSISVSRGVLKEETAEIAEVEYLVHNTAPDPRTVLVEQPVRPGWQLDSTQDPKPTETTPAAYRFRVLTGPRETVCLHIGQRHTLNQFYRLTDSSEAQLALLLRNSNAGPTLLAQLEPVFAAKRNLASIDTQINAKQTEIAQIVEDQKRLRDNLAALKGGAEERTLARRYTSELNTQEDTLANLRRDLANLQGQRQTAEADLNNKIESLTVNEKI